MNARNHSYVAIVDDDESVCRSFGRLLRTAGYQPVTYPSGESFLEDLKRPHFDCLLLDIQLNGISGIELSRRLSSVNDTTPVIFITAHDGTEVRAEAEASGCAGYFSKMEAGTRILDLIEKCVSPDLPKAKKPSTT